MKDKKISRRHFLRGAGGFALAIPFLPSLLPRAAWAQSAAVPKRFFALFGHFGYRSSHWSDDLIQASNVIETQASNGLYEIKRLRFADYLSSRSRINDTLADPTFNQLHDLLTIVEGLDPLGMNNGHGIYTALAAAKSEPDPEGDVTSESIDSVLKKSSAIYPDGYVPLRRVLNMTKGSGSCSIERVGGVYSPVPTDNDPKVIFQKLFDGVVTEPDPDADREKAKQIYLVDRVLEPLNDLMSNPRLSTADKSRLDQHITLVHELDQKIRSIREVVACTVPNEPPAGNDQAWYYHMTEQEQMEVFADLIVAGFACDSTRVMTMNWLHGPRNPVSNFHNDYTHQSEEDSNINATLLDFKQYEAEFFAEIIGRMNSLVEADGSSMLENSLAFWCNEMGSCNGGSHYVKKMQVLLAGRAGGAIDSGQFLSFRRQTQDRYGNPRTIGGSYNQLLVTILRALGLQRSDYEPYTEEAPGFGEYQGTRETPITHWEMWEPYRTESHRISLVPHLTTNLVT